MIRGIQNIASSYVYLCFIDITDVIKQLFNKKINVLRVVERNTPTTKKGFKEVK